MGVFSLSIGEFFVLLGFVHFLVSKDVNDITDKFVPSLRLVGL